MGHSSTLPGIARNREAVNHAAHMRNFLISNDSRFRAAVQTDAGVTVAFPHGGGGKIDGRNPEIIDGLHVLDDSAGYSERSHIGDPTLERIATTFTSQSITI